MVRLLVVSDFHGRPRHVKALEGVRRDITIAAGDLSTCGEVEEALEALDVLVGQGAPVVWVPGNCDSRELVGYERPGAFNVHGRAAVVDELVFAGVGGGLYSPFGTPFEVSDEELGGVLERGLREAAALLEKGSARGLVIVSHQPPYGSGLDLVARGEYVGSKRLVEAVAKYRPLLVACGHIHEAWGVAAVEGAIAVNAGPLRDRRYAVVDIDLERGAVRARTLRL